MLLLNVDRITKYHGTHPVFADLSWQIGEGERTGLVGPLQSQPVHCGNSQAPKQYGGERAVRRPQRDAVLHVQRRELLPPRRGDQGERVNNAAVDTRAPIGAAPDPAVSGTLIDAYTVASVGP